MSDHAVNVLFGMSLVTQFLLLVTVAFNMFAMASCTRRILRAIENLRENPENEPPQSKYLPPAHRVS